MTSFTPPAHVPAALRNLRNWVVWRLIWKEQGKPSKVPFYVNGSPRMHPGTPEDRQQMASYDEAVSIASSRGYDGIGFATLSDSGVVALDFDDCVTGELIHPEVAALCEGTYAEFSPSGTGVRAFMLGTVRSRKDSKAKHGSYAIEVFGDTGFVTFTGRVLPDHDLFGWTEVAPLTDAALSMYRTRFGDPESGLHTYGQGDVDEAVLMALEPKQGWSLAQARAVLFMCDASCSRDEWLKALMAMHHEFDGSAEALGLVDEWSATGANYGGTKDVEGRWRSFGRNTGARPTTASWLKRWAAECETRRRYKVAEDWKRSIVEAQSEYDLREVTCPKIRADCRLGELEREALAQVLLETFRSLGTKYPIAQCRKLIAEKRVEKIREKGGVDERDLPEWARGWVWVTDDDKWFRKDTEEWLTTQSFNAKYNREVRAVGEMIKTASGVALEDLQLPTVTRGMYAPMMAPGRMVDGHLIDDLTFQRDGVRYVNTFRPSSVPVASQVLGPDGQKAVGIVLRHIDLITGGRKDVAALLLSWLAFNVQWQGLKVRWAPLIKGVEGDGKTFFAALMSSMIGRANVRNVSPTVLGTDFTGWAEGACVAVLEEIKLTGHNRYDILNALKPYITNTSVEIHRKGRDPYNAENTQNYLAFTNHGDALPLGDTDRRWFVVFTPYSTSAELEACIAKFGVTREAYFAELFECVDRHGADLRRWFLDYQIADNFNANGTAPITVEKQRMIGLSKSPEESIVEEILEGGYAGVTPNVLASACLTEAMQLVSPEAVPQTSALNRLLSKMGWSKIPKRVKWNGRAHWIWTRSSVLSWGSEIKTELDLSLQNSAKSSESVANLFD